MEIRLELLRNLPAIIEQSVKPLERIDGIKIIDVRGMGQIAGETGSTGSNTGDGSLARSVVDQALRYRAQRPLVDALLKEVGLDDVADISGLLGTADTDTQASGADDTAASTTPTRTRKAASTATPKRSRKQTGSDSDPAQ